MSNGGILKTSFGLLALIVASRLVAMVREILLADRIGMNAYTDAFNISQSAITFFTGIIGATCVSLVPILVASSKGGEQRRDQVFTSLFCIYMMVALAVAVLLTVFSPEICRLLGPNLSPEAQGIAADLLRIGFIKVNCVVAGSLFAYYLQSKSIFIASGLSSLVGGVVIVALLLATPDSTIYDYTAYSVVGFACQFIVPLPLMLKASYRPRLRKLLEVDALKNLIVASVPLMGAMMFLEIQTLVGRGIATGLGEGAASSLDYANKIVQLLYASITMSLNGVLFTRIAECAVDGDSSKASLYLAAGGRNQLIFMLPLIIILAFFGEPLIAILLQRGHFTAEDTSAVYFVLLGYLVGAWPYVFSDLFAKYYVSLKRYKTINAVNAVGYCISLVIVGPMSWLLGAMGISLSFAIAQLLIMCGFVFVYFTRDGNSSLADLLRDFASAKDFLPAGVLVVALLAYRIVVGTPTPASALIISIVLIAAYLALLKPLRIRVGFNGIS